MSDPMQRWTNAMRAERYEEAWSINAAELAKREPSQRDDPSQPYHLRWVWDGRPFDGQDVLVRCYHGLGDTLQFARYLPLLGKRARSLSVEVQPSLLPLLANMRGIDRLIPFDPARTAPPAECDIEIAELAFALREPPCRSPAPYIHAAAAPLPRGTVGLCYAAGEWDVERCIPPALLERICRDRTCLSLVSEPTSLPVINPAGCPFDMMMTASIVAACDLVITVDTMIAHLAGALGRPTWLLLKAQPDWRWTPGASRTPWYPTMRIFTQPRPGEWEPVIQQVEQALGSFDPVTTGEPIDGQPLQPLGSGLLG
jgi:hypothetical protein